MIPCQVFSTLFILFDSYKTQLLQGIITSMQDTKLDFQGNKLFFSNYKHNFLIFVKYD